MELCGLQVAVHRKPVAGIGLRLRAPVDAAVVDSRSGAIGGNRHVARIGVRRAARRGAGMGQRGLTWLPLGLTGIDAEQPAGIVPRTRANWASAAPEPARLRQIPVDDRRRYRRVADWRGRRRAKDGCPPVRRDAGRMPRRRLPRCAAGRARSRCHRHRRSGTARPDGRLLADRHIDIVRGADRNLDVVRPAKQGVNGGIADLAPGGAGVDAAKDAAGAGVGEQSCRVDRIARQIERECLRVSRCRAVPEILVQVAPVFVLRWMPSLLAADHDGAAARGDAGNVQGAQSRRRRAWSRWRLRRSCATARATRRPCGACC